ncbi:polyprenol monophosphomannose synthase [Urbifossiella limnaea]|uniref:Undecaprenyl-phosphate mannosyltransferase n=1 Tax=Urbifossiella limnaea TaxID=2528023 RepID=A0A517XLR6_9BACT|nr:polyprenol monophosphomannose synthase [Urbifossiella limnaea]QDU18453.1 Undecaprenyl-phosphate mannosyltransferase [Urbifossiella limnaea]
MPAETASPAAEPRLLVSLATYNEAGNVAALIADIHKVVPQAHILVIDDNSPDGTGRIVDELATTDPRIHALHRPGKLGLGTATLAAMRYAMEHDYDLLQNMDADFSHPPRYLPGILAGMSKYDVMIGSRYVAGGATENWPVARKVMSRSVNTLVRFLFRMPVKDASGAYRCYRVSKLREVDLGAVRSRGYSFQQEVLFRCYKAGCKIGEYPILFENRRAGSSKVNRQEAMRSIGMILLLGLRNFFGLERRR